MIRLLGKRLGAPLLFASALGSCHGLPDAAPQADIGAAARAPARAEPAPPRPSPGLGRVPQPASASGEHDRFAFWVTDRGRYVTRGAEGDFQSLDGEVVMPAAEMSLIETEEEQGRYVRGVPEAEGIAFAFHVLLPVSYDPAVRYPLVVFLHHGWHVFRGTDNDGRMFVESPLFSGDDSLIRGPTAAAFPAVILVPQLMAKETLAGVEHEWAAFTSLDNVLGTVDSAPQPSRAAAFTLRVLGDLLAGTLPVAGGMVGVDPQRLYLTGHSMGGLGTWDWVQRWPAIWAAAVPMAGYPDHSAAGRVLAVPIWAFHHTLDCYNPYVGSQTMFKLVTAAQGTAMQLTELTFDTGASCEQAHFQTPKYAWQQPGLLVWLFSQVGSGSGHEALQQAVRGLP